MLLKKQQDWDFYYDEIPSTPVTQGTAKNLCVHKKLRARFIVTVLVIAVMAMVITIRSEAIVTSGYAMVQEKNQVAAVERENDALRLENARLRSPQRIQQIATRDLGMIIPKSVYMASINGSHSATQTTPTKSFATLTPVQ